MPPQTLRRVLLDSLARRCARAALDNHAELVAIRKHIFAEHGAETLDAVDAECPFVMLALIAKTQ